MTRTVILAFAITFILSQFILFRNKNGVRFRFFNKTAVVFVIITISAGFFLVQNKQFNSYITNLHTAYTRVKIWNNSIQMAGEHLLTGVGAGSWQIYFPKYGLDKFNVTEVKNGLTTYQRPHNDFLWVLCETGIIGLLIYFCIFITASYYLLKLLKNSNDADETKWHSILFAGIAGYMLIAFADFPFERIEHQVLLLLIFSIITSRYYQIYQNNTPSNKLISITPIFSFLFYISIAVSLFICVNRLSGEYHTHKLYTFRNKGDWNNVIKEADNAINSCYTLDPMSAPIEWYKGVALFTTGNISESRKSFERAFSIHPYNIHVINNLASCYESMGDHDDAKEMYIKALKISSDFEEARLNLSAVYYNMKEYDNAFFTIDKCSVESKDPKYQAFLPAILTAQVGQIMNRNKSHISDKTLKDTNFPQEKIIKIYEESKSKNANFEESILKQVIQ